MKIFTCENRFEDKMTCIFNAWEEALKCGHDMVRLMTEPVLQFTLMDTYVHVPPDREKSDRVIRAIMNKISFEAYSTVYYAALSDRDTLDDIYRFLNLGFKQGAKVTRMMTEPCVMTMVEERRKVLNEAHFSREFLRFNSIDNKVYVAHWEPKCDVIYLAARHFADRMPSEHFMIIDEKRKYAVVHPKDSEMYMMNLTEDELVNLSQTEVYGDAYRELWSTFFEAIGIRERENRRCQRNLFPLHFRKHAVEFMDETKVINNAR